MNLQDFVAESNRIEGIHRAPADAEVAAHEHFIRLPRIAVDDMVQLVSMLQPNAVLRSRKGLDVRIGSYYPPPGGVEIKLKLGRLLDALIRYPERAYSTHLAYEALHPFTDGNGRSGRALWLWQMGGDAPLGFLHKFYYQTLQASGR